MAGNTLRYGTFSDGQWLIETVDGPDVAGWAASIVVDEAGTVHIAYGNAMGGILKYAVGVLEPSTLALVALGGLALLRRRR